MLPDATATAHVHAVVATNGKMFLKLDNQTLELVVRKSESLASRMLNTLIYSTLMYLLGYVVVMLACDSVRTLADRCQGQRDRAVQLEDGFDGQNDSEDNGESEKHSESSSLQEEDLW